MKNYFCLSVAMALLLGCATTANFQKQLNMAIGRDISVISNAWGYPNDTSIAPNGNKVYVYHKSQYDPGYYYQTPSRTTVYATGGRSASAITQPGLGLVIGQQLRSCTVWIEVNEYNTIVNWRAEGNECRM